MSKLSPRMLKEMHEAQPDPVGEPPVIDEPEIAPPAPSQEILPPAPPQVLDERPAAFAKLIDNEDDGVLQNVFEGTRLLQDADRLTFVRHLRAEVRVKCHDIARAYLDIGNALIDAERKLTKAEFDRLMRGSERMFSFSQATAAKLIRVARAVNLGKIEEAKCPPYTVAYLFCTMPEADLEEAKKIGLLRPDVARDAVEQFRKARKQERGEENKIDLVALAARKTSLRRRRDRLIEQLDQVRDEIEEIDRLIRGDTLPNDAEEELVE